MIDLVVSVIVLDNLRFEKIIVTMNHVNVLYHYFDQYHYFDRLEARFAKYDDSDSESKNIIYLLSDVSRS
jgi:hypothetical protein